MSKDKNMRSAIVRVSAKNVASKDNAKIGVHAGDTISYSIDDIVNQLEKWTKTKYFYYFVIEHKSDPNNIHFHFVIEFMKNSVGRFSQIKEMFPYGQIANCKYGIKQCVQYLVHMNDPTKPQYSWDDVITNSPERLSLYKVPGRATIDMKTQDILDKIVAGKIREYQIDQIPPEIYLNYGHKIRMAFDYRQQAVISNPHRDILVIVLQGPPRVGKSTFCKVWAEKNNMSICFSSGSNDPWQDYKGQDIFVYDDFNYENTKIEDLLKALDPHNNTTISSRYRNRLFLGNTIFICTNVPIYNWYCEAGILLRSALYKRFARVLVFGELNDEGKVSYIENVIRVEGHLDRRNIDGLWVPPDYHIEIKPVSEARVFDLGKYINTTADSSLIESFVAGLGEI